MMLMSNYDNRLAGVGGAPTAGGVNRNTIICKHDCKLKRPNMFKKPIVVDRFFACERANAPPHLFCVDRMLVLRVLEKCLKRLKAANREARTPQRHGVGLSNC